MTSKLNQLFGLGRCSERTQPTGMVRSRKPRCFHPRIEQLEDRRVLSTVVGTQSFMLGSSLPSGHHEFEEAFASYGPGYSLQWFSENPVAGGLQLNGEIGQYYPTGPGSMLRSDNGGWTPAGPWVADLDAVVQEGSDLNYYCAQRDGNGQFPNGFVFRGTITHGALSRMGEGLSQASFVLGDDLPNHIYRNLELVVWEATGLNSYTMDSNTGVWTFNGTITPNATGPGSLVYGDYVGTSGRHNLEVVVPEHSRLNHYWRDADTGVWHFGGTVTTMNDPLSTSNMGAASLVLGDYVASNGHRNLELVVQQGQKLNHYDRDADSLTWHYGATILTDASGPATLVLGDYVASNGHANLELIANEGNGGVTRYYRDATTLTWKYAETIFPPYSPPAPPSAAGPGLDVTSTDRVFSTITADGPSLSVSSLSLGTSKPTDASPALDVARLEPVASTAAMDGPRLSVSLSSQDNSEPMDAWSDGSVHANRLLSDAFWAAV